MRVAIVTESFLPQVNGVTRSVVQTSGELRWRGHHVLVVAPSPDRRLARDPEVVRTRSFPLPGYPEVRVGFARQLLDVALDQFLPDVVHLASPVVLGAAALRVCRERNYPTVAVFQTDLARYASCYHLPGIRAAAWRWLRRLHNQADLTLAPTPAVGRDLRDRGFRRVKVWGRGVDLEAFSPSWRSSALRRSLAPNGELILGYVGRLAPDKEVDLLSHVHGMPGTALVVVGDGPSLGRLRRRLPAAVFTGRQEGAALSRLYASFDLLVHTGRSETFGQVIQEALASGTPVLAPAAGGPLDLVEVGGNGLLWPPRMPEAMRRQVARLLGDRALLDRLAAGARRSVAGRSWGAVVTELESHYLAVHQFTHRAAA